MWRIGDRASSFRRLSMSDSIHIRYLKIAVPLAALALTFIGAVGAGNARGQGARTGIAVCPRPSDRCDSPQKSFAAYELPFRLPKRLAANVEYESAPFYAIILKRLRDPGCDGGEYTKSLEAVRRDAQKRFPNQKVFADHQCPDMGAVSYTPVGAKRDESGVEAFVAVYAGKTEKEAQAVLTKARTAFPGASLTRLKVGYSRIVQ
jgi:hypothetical protein